MNSLGKHSENCISHFFEICARVFDDFYTVLAEIMPVIPESGCVEVAQACPRDALLAN